MKFSYKVLINIQEANYGLAKYARPDDDSYQDGDLLVETWAGEVEANDSLAAAWKVVRIHNMDGRPDGQIGPSFSGGDVVAISTGPVTIHYASTSYDLVQVKPPFNLSDSTYLELVAR